MKIRMGGEGWGDKSRSTHIHTHTPTQIYIFYTEAPARKEPQEHRSTLSIPNRL